MVGLCSSETFSNGRAKRTTSSMTPRTRPRSESGVRHGSLCSAMRGHAALPTLGISAGLAIEDAAVLGECLRSSTNEVSALRSYERQRRRVTARVVRAAAIFGRILMIERQPAYGLRQLGVRLAPQRLGVGWLVGGAALRE